MSAAEAEALVAVLADGWLAAVTTAVCQASLARLRFRRRIVVIRGEAVTAVLDGVVPLTGQLTGWDGRPGCCGRRLSAAATSNLPPPSWRELRPATSWLRPGIRPAVTS